jgi:tRNA modification GTPase
VPYLRSVNTIVALSTPPGSGALGILRLSGDQALTLIQPFFPGIQSWTPRHAHFARFVVEGNVLDEVVAITFPGPNSYTGEDVVELSFHGSPFILESALNALLAQGAQLAKAGEFTQRAFFNGKLDLSQAEAVGDLIASESASAHRLAFRQMKGSISKRLQALRQQLIDFAALIELELDFVEEDVEFAQRPALLTLLSELEGEIQKMLQTFKLGRAIKDGIPLVLAGAPNAGKSTLLNRMLNEDRAIVTDIPGTTRDTIEEKFKLGDHVFRLIDTAGLHESDDTVERLGIQKSWEKIQEAQFILHLIDPQTTAVSDAQGLQESLRSKATDAHILTVLTKVDEWTSDYGKHWPEALCMGEGSSMDDLEARLNQGMVEAGWASHSEEVLIANARHAEALQAALHALMKAHTGLEGATSGELVAYDLREALQHLGSITGEIVADDLLSSVFSRFCIGK